MRLLGFTLGILSGLFFALALLCFKKVCGMGSIQITCLFNLIGFLFLAAYSGIKGKAILAHRNTYTWLIGISCMFSNYLFYLAANTLSFGDVIAILYSSPVIIGLLAYYILKEPYGIFDILTTLIMVIGVMFIVQPTFLKDMFGIHQRNQENIDIANTTLELTWNENGSHINKSGLVCINTDVYGDANRSERHVTRNITGHYSSVDGRIRLPRIWACALDFVAAISSAFIHIFRRKSTEIPAVTSICQLNLVSFLFGLPILSAFGLWRFPVNLGPWLWFVAGSVMINLGGVFWLAALTYETAAAVVIARTTEIPIGYALQIAFFHDIPTSLDISGAVLVTVTVLAYGGRRYWQERRTTEAEKDTLLGGQEVAE
jgi:drug/metabolite transporter (DMT)-like permease